MASACLPAQEHIIDLNGDVVLALLDPGAVFAECEPRNDTRVRSPDLCKALADALKRTAHQGPDRNDSDCIRGSILASNLAAATERKGGIVKKPNSKARRKLRRQALFRSTAGLSAKAVNDTESQNPSPENSATAAIDGDSPTVQAQPVHLLEAVTRPVFPSHEEGQARNSPSTVSSVRFLVSSRSLSLASKVFEIQLNGGWKEATIDARDSRHHLEVAGWNADAFLILMNIFHARTKTVPEDISLEMLTRIAVLVDYYGCHEAVEPFAAVWIKALARPVLLRGHRDLVLWLLISLIFRQEELFASTTRTIIMQSSTPFATHGLPIPDHLLDIMNSRRLDAIHCIFSTLHHLQAALLDESAGCNFECSSALHGALAKNLHIHRLLRKRKFPKQPFHGHSIATLELAIQTFRSPRWDCPGSHPSGAENCQLPHMISERLGKKLGQVKLELSLSEVVPLRPCHRHAPMQVTFSIPRIYQSAIDFRLSPRCFQRIGMKQQ